MKPVVQKVVAGGILLHEGKILIVQRSADDTYPGLWEVPSGKKEELEQIETTIKREFKEEAGIEIEPVKPLSVFNFKVEKDSEIRDATQINFLVKAVESVRVKLSSEHQNSAWVTETEIDNYEISPETKQALHMAFKA
jgi:8-oxo-dGTP diphosphatase